MTKKEKKEKEFTSSRLRREMVKTPGGKRRKEKERERER